MKKILMPVVIVKCPANTYTYSLSTTLTCSIISIYSSLDVASPHHGVLAFAFTPENRIA